eukprot:1193656-Prorocentrum_minimum.AAC.1
MWRSEHGADSTDVRCDSPFVRYDSPFVRYDLPFARYDSPFVWCDSPLVWQVVRVERERDGALAEMAEMEAALDRSLQAAERAGKLRDQAVEQVRNT